MLKVVVEEAKVPEEEDIEAQLEQEVASLRTNGEKNKNFSVVDSGVKSIVFISATVSTDSRSIKKLLCYVR